MTDAIDQEEDEAAPEVVEHVSLSDAEFKTQLAQVIPHLNHFHLKSSGVKIRRKSNGSIV